MERIRKSLLVFLFILVFGVLYSQNINKKPVEEKEKKTYKPVEVLNGIREKFYSLIPNTFSSYIESDVINDSLKKIPDKAITDKNNMRVKIFFHKEWGVRIILEGVIDPFKNRFSYMEKIFDFIKPFNYKDEEFFKTYEIFDIREDSFKLRKKGGVRTHLKLFFDTDFNIKKVQEYKDNRLVTTVFIKYIMIDKNILIDRIRVLFYEENNLKILEFWLKDFDINIDINEDIFLGYYYGHGKDKGFIC